MPGRAPRPAGTGPPARARPTSPLTPATTTRTTHRHERRRPATAGAQLRLDQPAERHGEQDPLRRDRRRRRCRGRARRRARAARPAAAARPARRGRPAAPRTTSRRPPRAAAPRARARRATSGRTTSTACSRSRRTWRDRRNSTPVSSRRSSPADPVVGAPPGQQAVGDADRDARGDRQEELAGRHVAVHLLQARSRPRRRRPSSPRSTGVSGCRRRKLPGSGGGRRRRVGGHAEACRASPRRGRPAGRAAGPPRRGPGRGSTASVAAAAVCSWTVASPNRRSSGPAVTSTNCIRPYGTTTSWRRSTPRVTSRSSSRSA